MNERWVPVGSFRTPFEASLAKGRLEACEIDATLQDAEMVRLEWWWSNALGGVKVLVPASEVEEARRVLAQVRSGAFATPEADAATACPRCGGAATHFYLDQRGSFLTWLVLGVPIVRAVSKRECAACGHRWRA